MDNYKKYDELDDIVSTLYRLIDDISDKYYEDILYEVMVDARNERDELEEVILAEEQAENEELESEYWKGAI